MARLINEFFMELKKKRNLKKLYKKIKKHINVPVSNILTKEVKTIKSDELIRNAAQMMKKENTSSLIVQEHKKVVGILSEIDFVKKVQFDKEVYNNLQIKNIMTKEVIKIDPSTTIIEASNIIIKKKVRKLLVVKNKKTKGIVTQTDIVTKLNEFASKTIIESIDLDKVRYVMNKNVVSIEKGKTVAEARDIMTMKNVGCIVVTKEGKPDGIITEKDILNQMVKNIEFMKKANVEHIMTSPVTTIAPDITVIEANRIMLMLEKNFRRLPVVVDDEMIGILSQTDVSRGIFEFIVITMKKIENKEVKDIDVTKIEEEIIEI